MIVWLLLTWLAVGLLLYPEISRRRHRAPSCERAQTTIVQVLFAEHEGTRVAVDCVLLEPLTTGGRTLPVGFPISLHFEPLGDAVLSAAVCNVIGRWAEETRIVTMRLFEADGLVHANLTDHETTLQLDVEGAYG